MEPKKVGRALGIGVRVASKMVQQRVAQASQAETAQTPAPASAQAPGNPAATAQAGPAAYGRPVTSQYRPEGKQGRVIAGDKAIRAKRGLSAFGQALLGPFTHAGSILWLEITGLFFALFAAFFVQSVYRARHSWRSGPDHFHLMLYVVLALGFAWFSGSSFLRARRKGRQGPVRRTGA